MEKVTKVLMFVWRKTKDKKEFLVLHRPEQKDRVVLTGRVEGGESFKEAVEREIGEELGLKPKNIIDLNFQVLVKIKEGRLLSQEHAFLVEIPPQEVNFLEYKAEIHWYSLKELAKVLTYPNQREAVARIK